MYRTVHTKINISMSVPNLVNLVSDRIAHLMVKDPLPWIPHLPLLIASSSRYPYVRYPNLGHTYVAVLQREYKWVSTKSGSRYFGYCGKRIIYEPIHSPQLAIKVDHEVVCLIPHESASICLVITRSKKYITRVLRIRHDLTGMHLCQDRIVSEDLPIVKMNHSTFTVSTRCATCVFLETGESTHVQYIVKRRELQVFLEDSRIHINGVTYFPESNIHTNAVGFTFSTQTKNILAGPTFCVASDKVDNMSVVSHSLYQKDDGSLVYKDGNEMIECIAAWYSSSNCHILILTSHGKMRLYIHPGIFMGQLDTAHCSECIVVHWYPSYFAIQLNHDLEYYAYNGDRLEQTHVLTNVDVYGIHTTSDGELYAVNPCLCQPMSLARVLRCILRTNRIE